MEVIKMKKVILKPSYGFVYVEEIQIDEGEIGFKMPNLSHKEKTEGYGRIVFANEKQLELVGEFVTIDPWRSTPKNTGGKRLVKLSLDEITFVVDGGSDEQKEI